MTIPEIKYYTSPVYERVWWNFRKTKPPRIDPEAFDYLVAQIRARKNQTNQYLREMTTILGIEWHRKEIEVTMLPLNIGCFSRPLTLSLARKENVPRDIEGVVDDLTHELIHNTIIEHPNYPKAIENLSKDYPEDPPIAHIHVLVHAVHAIIYETSRGAHRMERDIRMCQKNPPYKKAWEIVQTKTPRKILKKYLSIEEERHDQAVAHRLIQSLFLEETRRVPHNQ